MRVKRGVAAHKKHQKIRSLTKGMTRSNRSSIKRGRQATIKALQFSYRDRRNKKRELRSLWNTRINAAARINGISYSQLISKLKSSNINLDRKILSELATNYPDSFKTVVETATKKK
ncbi:MAG TPA: 50S ribosomal protein L20 [Candidatus Dormibacteraeota bacterium]|nr:50S ribosomal protein L20 [Candidatus Dormibacteraeota bacterium]